MRAEVLAVFPSRYTEEQQFWFLSLWLRAVVWDIEIGWKECGLGTRLVEGEHGAEMELRKTVKGSGDETE